MRLVRVSTRSASGPARGEGREVVKAAGAPSSSAQARACASVRDATASVEYLAGREERPAPNPGHAPALITAMRVLAIYVRARLQATPGSGPAPRAGRSGVCLGLRAADPRRGKALAPAHA